MEIKYCDKIKLKEISKKYVEIHNQYNNLENQIKDIISKRDELSSRLHSLRDAELNLINKIESETGEKLTTETLKDMIC